MMIAFARTNPRANTHNAREPATAPVWHIPVKPCSIRTVAAQGLKTNMKDLFFFDSMLTPKIITFVYWLGLLSVVIGGFGSIFSHYGSIWSGLGIIIGGTIGVRIWCELLIVLFKIHENLQKIANRE
jgi:hypothetical protein